MAKPTDQWQILPTVSFIVGCFLGFVFVVSLFMSSIERRNDLYSKRDILTNVDIRKDIPLLTHFHQYNSTAADELFDKVRITCVIVSSPSKYDKNPQHILNTWGKRCNIIVFTKNSDDIIFGPINIPLKANSRTNWLEMYNNLAEVYKNHHESTDWFLKVNDNSYVVMENLRYMLYPHSPDELIYLGCKLAEDQLCHEAGYVMSKAALRELVAGTPKVDCQDVNASEENQIVKNMKLLGAVNINSYDEFGRGTIFPNTPAYHLTSSYWRDEDNFWSYIFLKRVESYKCCSDKAVMFGHILPKYMYVMEYFLYHLHPYGIAFEESLPVPMSQNVTSALP